jgi:DNA-binding CsgD family transcriptional regulator
MLDVAAVAQSLSTVLMALGLPDTTPNRVAAIASRTSDPDVLGRALVAGLPRDSRAVLAIDDYQYAAESNTERLIAHLVLNTDLRVLLMSRVRPSWLSARLCIYGDAFIVLSNDLAFTDEEAHAVLRDDARSPRADLVARAAGWPAVIGLAAGHGTTITAATGHLPAELYRFIAQDLFDEAGDSLREALYKLALVGDLETPLIHDVLGPDSASSLADATTSGFVTRAEGGAVELHPLLRTFLVDRISELPEREQRVLVGQVIEHLHAARKWDAILRLLSEFRNPPLAEELLESAFQELVEAGRLSTIKRWLELTESAAGNPMLLLARAEVALREGANAEAQALAERATELSLIDELTARAHLVAARAAHLAGDDAGARRNAAGARKAPAPSKVHIAAQWLEFLQAFESEPRRAAEILEELRLVGDRSPDHALRLRQSRAFLDLETHGDVAGAIRQLELAEPLLADVSDPINRSSFLNLFSSACLYAGSYARAIEIADLQIEEAASAGLSFAVDHGMLTRAAALTGRRRIGEAGRILQSLERSTTASSFVAAQVVLRLSRLRVTIGDLLGACELIQPPPPSGIPPALRGEWLATRALYEAALGRLDNSAKSLRAALGECSYIDAVHLGRLTEVTAGLRRRSTSRARTETTTAFRELISRGHVDAIVVGCRAYPQLATAASADNEIRSALVDIFAASNDRDIARASGLHIPRNRRAHGLLSGREVEVSELMAQGRTNREIAGALFISESTTKVHVKHILEKLGVRSRTEAVRALLDGD